MLKRKSSEQWIAEQRARYPHWDREVRQFDRLHGPKRKLTVLCDECLEEDLVVELRRASFLRVIRARKRLDDEALWRRARQEQMVIVTGDDSDFWNDRKYPVQTCPGIIILQGKTASEKMRSYRRLLAEWDIVKNYRNLGVRYFVGLKLKATPDHVFGKLYDGGDIVTF